MKVKELIEKLETFNQDKDVIIGNRESYSGDKDMIEVEEEDQTVIIVHEVEQ